MADLVGKTFAYRYQVIEFIGRGGMAEVYKVWDPDRMIYLAAKVLQKSLAMDKVFLRRFKREADSLSKLQHPNIVRYYGLHHDGDIAFMLLDFIDGPSLQEWIFKQGQQISTSMIMQFTRSICGALHYAHSQGVVHCDIKPGNIMVNQNNHILLTDFGIARMTDAATATMVGFGTPAYMPPELVYGKDPTPQSDIYSFGIVLYEMVTGGERPFTGEHARKTGSTSEKVRWEQLNLAPPSPLQYNPHLSGQLEEVILRCLAKDPAMRFNSALELLNSLELASAGKLNTQNWPQYSVGSELGARIQQVPDSVPTWKVPEPQRDLRAGEHSALAKRTKLNFPVWIFLCLGVILLSVLLIFLLRPPLLQGNNVSQITQSTDNSQMAAVIEPVPQDPDVTPGTASLSNSGSDPNALSISTQAAFSESIIEVTETSPSMIIPTVEEETLTTLKEIGLTFTRSSDNMLMLNVSAGDFTMGSIRSDPDAHTHEKPQRQVYLDAFWMDAYEVSNAMFSFFVSQTGYQTQAEKQGYSYMYNASYQWEPAPEINWRHPMGLNTYAQDSLPVVHVSYYDAIAYCAWAGGRLPTEAEWEKAARGSDGRVYPWGNPFNSGYLRFNSSTGPTSVDNFEEGKSPFGIYNLAGNAFEWTNDWYSPDFYGMDINNNPSGAAGGEFKVIRGGSWNNSQMHVRIAHRDTSKPDYMNYLLGFRCAMDAD